MTARENAKKYVKNHTAVAVGVVLATSMIPGAASVALIAQEGIMCFQIGKIYGHNITEKDGVRIAASIGLASVTGQIIALEASIVTGPFAFVIKPAIAAGIVRVLGDQIIAYFERNKVIVPPVVENRICLIGKTGSGKSSTGNALLKNYFFEVNAANGSTTQAKSGAYKNGYNIIDTPGLLDSRNYDAEVIAEVIRARITIYVSAQAPYGPELEFIKNINNKYLQSSQFLLFYLNNQDERDRMPPNDRLAVFHDAVKRLTGVIPENNISTGASSPVEFGRNLPPRIENLEYQINSIINK